MILEDNMIEQIVYFAEMAGDAVLEVYNSDDFGVETKDDSSPLTKADIASNNIIIDGLKTLTPEVPIISEENKEVDYETRKNWPVSYLIDPLDGTKEFIKKNGEFTVNIALIENGEPVFGVVHAPVLGVTYYGIKGIGAFKKTKEQKFGTGDHIKVMHYTTGKVKVVSSRSHRGDRVDNFLSTIEDYECVAQGSSLKLCLVAEGSAHIYPRLGPTMEWDTAAAQCVVECAGGHVTDLDGQRLRYNKENLLNPDFMATGDPAFPWQKHI